LVALLKGWGVDYTPLKVVLDPVSAQRIRNPADPERAATPYPLWLHLTDANFSKSDPVTASLTGVNLASAGALAPTKDATTKFEPLLFSSSQASLYDRNDTLVLKDPGALTAAVHPGGKPITLAARVTGRAVFPGVAEGNINIIVLADTDIWDDRFWLDSSEQGAGAPFADNEGFVLNAVESLTGSDDLISLRARGNVDHPFTRVRQMQAEAEGQFRETLDALRAKLAGSQSALAELQQGGQATALTPQQQAAIDKARRDIAATRGQLREVQRNLNADIDRLGSLLAFLNILAMPLLVAGFGVIFGLIRRRRARATVKRAP
ncbi:MAG: ABC transporter, partial [Alphaproteobacteria bacterium]|nr:ABC transporter [Alphaproteobacteria bacterium]